jgi:hypothetical protein
MGHEPGSRSGKRTRVAEAFPTVGHKVLFMFDYGDDWPSVVEVIGPGERDPMFDTRRSSAGRYLQSESPLYGLR